jgi:hypothetical protein
MLTHQHDWVADWKLEDGKAAPCGTATCSCGERRDLDAAEMAWLRSPELAQAHEAAAKC